MEERAPKPTENVIRNVRLLRRRRELSAEQFAQELQRAGCEIKRQAITNMENGRRGVVSVDELFAFAHVLGVPVESLTNTPTCATCQDAPPAGFSCNACGKVAACEQTAIYSPTRAGRPRPAPAQKRRNRITCEHLDEVARVYTAADEAGKPPTQAVADHFQASHSTAARWVGMARRQEKLPAARMSD